MIRLWIVVSTLLIFACSDSRATVLVVVRQGKTIWFGANANMSAKTPSGYRKAGEDCKIFPSSNHKLVMLHEGLVTMPDTVGGSLNLVEMERKAFDPRLSLTQNRQKIIEAIESTFTRLAHIKADQLRKQKLPPMFGSGDIQQLILVSDAGASISGFLFDVAIYGDTPKFTITEIPFPKAGNFSLVLRGDFDTLPTVKPWVPSAKANPSDWIYRQISKFTAEDSAVFGGEIAIGKMQAGRGFEWVQTTKYCR